MLKVYYFIKHFLFYFSKREKILLCFWVWFFFHFFFESPKLARTFGSVLFIQSNQQLPKGASYCKVKTQRNNTKKTENRQSYDPYDQLKNLKVQTSNFSKLSLGLDHRLYQASSGSQALWFIALKNIFLIFLHIFAHFS